MDPHNASVVQQKREIDDAIALEEADGPWKWTEIFKNGPFKIRRRFLLVIGKFENAQRYFTATFRSHSHLAEHVYVRSASFSTAGWYQHSGKCL